MKNSSHEKLSSERNKLLRTIVNITEGPLMVLGFIWLGLLILELINKSNRFLETLGVGIWIIFILDFILKLIISTSKARFLRKNILTIVSLIIPAFRLLRIVRFIRLVRVSRGIRLVKMIGSFNRGMRSLAKTMQKRAIGYVIVLSVIVVFIGAAGLYAFEKDVNPGFKNFSSSLWWTAMLIMSMGTDNWPVTPEARVLCFLIAIYGLAVFGYVTASLASFFIGKDAEEKASAKGTTVEIEQLKKEIMLLRDEIQKLNPSKNHL